jgi:hypothetical protein
MEESEELCRWYFKAEACQAEEDGIAVWRRCCDLKVPLALKGTVP